MTTPHFPADHPRPLDWATMTKEDKQAGIKPVFDVFWLPQPEQRYRKYEEQPQDYRPGGYAHIKEGDLLNYNRYKIMRKLGVGHFCTVWLAWDRM